MTTATFEKQIQYDHGDYKMTLDGRYIGHASTYHQAEVTLNEVVHEMLVHGDCATAEELDGEICALCELAPCECETAYTFSADPPPPPDIPDEYPDPTPGGPPPPEYAFPLCIACQTSDYPPSSRLAETCVECANAWFFGLKNRFAVTLQSQAIEAKLATCGYCRGIHHIQSCPSLRQAVSAELGRGLCQLLWRNHAGFVALISGATPARRVEFAESYLRFLASYSSTNLTVRKVLAVWSREIGGDRGSALERAA